MQIHREGYTSIIIVIILMIIIICTTHFLSGNRWILLFAYVLSVFLLLTVLHFFRKPIREAAVDANHILAPADGKIVAIEEVQETEYFREKRLQVSIFMSPTDVHINWTPAGGQVKYVKYHPGKHLVAWHPKSSTDNECNTVVIATENGTAVLMRQIAGAVARRIVCYVKEGDEVAQGAEMGFIKFGSRVDVLLPINVKMKVKLGQSVKGTKTLLACFE